MASQPTDALLTIRQLRERRGLTTAEIEQLSAGAVKHSALKAIERGIVRNPTYQTVSALAEVFRISPDACYRAIAASVAARAQEGPRPRGRPRQDPPAPAPALTLTEALALARTLQAALEQLEAGAAEEVS